MKKFTFSLLIAIGIHIIVLLLSSLLIGDKKNTFFEYQNLIPVKFGIGTKNPGRAEKLNPSKIKTAIPARSRNKIEQTAGPASLSNGDGVNPESNSESTSGNSFDSSITSYEGPAYPRIAQVRGLQGSVRIRIIVSAEGLASETILLKSSGHQVLDQAAIDVTSKWRFKKKSSPYYVEKNIVFELKN